jgi:alkylated DNA repair dioxygenase AlkB
MHKINVNGGNLYIVKEKDESFSIVYYHPTFFSEYDNVKKKLFELNDWKGVNQKSKNRWVAPRLQRWSHVDSKPFHVWKKEFLRWNHVEYTDWLLQFQNDVSSMLQPLWIDIKNHVSEFNIPVINSILLNKYRDGNDRIHLHKDHVSELGKDPTIVTASFGDSRIFSLVRVSPYNERHLIIDDNSSNLNIDIELVDKSLLIMAGACQRYYGHTIPQTDDVKGARISCTFREHN